MEEPCENHQSPPQGWIFPTFVGHRRRHPPESDLFDVVALSHDQAGQAAAKASAHNERLHTATEAALGKDRDLAAYLSQRYQCSTCRATLPTAHLLDVHVAEVHDSFFAAQAARRMPVYACLVENCGRHFCTAEDRKHHLVDHHKFSKEFNFDRMHLR